MATKTSKTACRKATAATPTQTGLLFETSWEVCNKIGGIYAVLSTKARQLKEQFGDNLIFIGPDVWTEENASPVFKEKKTLLKSASSKIELPWGITIRTGRWDIPGTPAVVLVNPGETASHINEIYALAWERYGVDSLHAYGDYEEGCVFAVASAIVMKALAEHLKVDGNNVTAHFNEWTTAMGLLYLQTTLPQASTLFTTHATCIGRSICGNGKELYQYFNHYNGDQMARELNMEAKHSLEKAAAHAADCFTTVSEVTARECEQLLDIRPQVVTPNGFEPDFVPKTVKYNKLRKEGRAKLLEVASTLTGENFGDDTFIIATSGRLEYRNKGLNLFIDAMARIEEQMQESEKAVAFIMVPAWVKEPNARALGNFTDVNNSEPDFMTHRLFNEHEDAVCRHLSELRSQGRFGKLRVIYVPSYLNGNDGVVNISYYNMLPALDLTLFPSYYEPWGYTPLESTAFGVPTVTTDKAGFGQWVLDNFRNGLDHCGVFVTSREDSNYNESKELIADAAARYMATGGKERTDARHAAFITAEKADWAFFIKYYEDAFRVAADRRNARCRQ